MKGPKNAWREREQRKKHISKIATLKKYAKLAKREGIVSDRVRMDNPSTSPDQPTREQDQQNSEPRPVRKEGNDKAKKTDDHTRVTEQSKRKSPAEEERERREQMFAQREQEKQAASHRRKEMHKIMTKRTSKGQPVMAGRIKNILGKLMDEAKSQHK